MGWMPLVTHLRRVRLENYHQAEVSSNRRGDGNDVKPIHETKVRTVTRWAENVT